MNGYRFPSPVLVNSPLRASFHAPRFNGLMAELEAKKQGTMYILSELLETQYFEAMGKPLTGISILEMVEEAPRKSAWSGNSGYAAKGSEAQYIANQIRPHVNGFWKRLRFNNKLFELLDALVKHECLTSVYPNAHSGSRAEYLLTEKGKRLLEEARQKKLTGQKLPATKTSPVSVSVQSNPVKPVTEKSNFSSIRLKELKVLMMANSSGRTGWQVLQKIKDLTGNQNFLSRFLRKGPEESVLREACGISPQHSSSFFSQLLELHDAGFLSYRHHPRWALTSKGLHLLKSGLHWSFHRYLEQDFKALLIQEKSRLEASKADKKKAADAFETTYQAELKMTQCLAEEMKTLKSGILELEVQQENAGELEICAQHKNLKSPVSLAEKLLELQHLEAQLVLREHACLKLKCLSETAHSSYLKWLAQTNQTIQKLIQAEIKLETTEANRNFTEFRKDIQEIVDGLQWAEDPLLVGFSNILNDVDDRYYTSQAALELTSDFWDTTSQGEMGAAMAALQAIRDHQQDAPTFRNQTTEQ